jgi:class 3 adenylate cyclase/tetratricopeptide (TPR) repeat protein
MDITRREAKNYDEYARECLSSEWLENRGSAEAHPAEPAPYNISDADHSTKWRRSYGIISQTGVKRPSYLKDHLFVAMDLPWQGPVVTRTTIDLAKWLGTYGLGEYAQTFAENHIDFSVLPDLTENDLEKLGVLLGHRKKLLRAIEALSTERQSGVATKPASQAEPEILSASPDRQTELRQITVMFCDLVDSTPLSGKLDLEDVQALIDAYREACSTAIKRYEGRIARYFGDGVMVFFGWPRAHEDDAIRAVHAALESVSAIPKISGPVTLAARVGISSGPVVISEIGSAVAAPSMDATGETPTVAARLQTLAPANGVVISESTKRRIAAAFELEDLGFKELKGIDKPVHVYRVLAAKTKTSRFEAAHTGSLTPFVGRSTELNVLLDRWQKVKEGDGQVVLLSGIPGVGKSRLVHELRLQIEQEPHFLLQHQCSPYHSQSAFFPIIEQVEQALQLSGQQTDTEKLAKIKAQFSRPAGDLIDRALLIAKLLSIPTESHDELSALTPQQIKNRTISTLIEKILDLSDKHPTLCIFEDVHWIDPSTLELLEFLISRIDRARVLIVVSCRPEFQHTWFKHANVTMHSLTRLSRSEVSGMVTDLLRGASIPSNILDEIIAKADGVPLFIEELTSSIASSEQTAQPAALRVPETLHDALMERLDRVAPGPRVAQIAATIGREFPYDLLSAASRIDDDDLSSALSQLEEADIIHRVGISPLVRYQFKHVLLRDAIYHSLLRSKRRQFHEEIAAALASQFPAIVENQPELLAHHYSEAGNNELAIQCWYKAGHRALTNSANVEAIAHFRKALELMNTLADTPERRREEIKIQLALGIPLIAVAGYAAEETRQAFERARSLCLGLQNPPEYFQALYGLWGHSWMGGKNDQALALANEFVSRSRASDDITLSMMAHRIMGSTLLTVGEFKSSREHFEKTIALSKASSQGAIFSQYMVEPQVASLLLAAWDLWFLGYPDQALCHVSEALSLARDLRQPYSIAFAHYMTSVVRIFRGEPEHALVSADESLEMSREQRFSLYVLLSTISRGRALGELGRLREARAEIELGLEQARTRGVGFMLPMMRGWLAEVYSQSGEDETALSMIEQTLSEISDVTGRAWVAELRRQQGEIILSHDPTKLSQAEFCFKAAIEIASRQSSRSLQVRAATSLAKLWQSQGRLEEARDLIGPIFAWFTEGSDTKDLKRARDIQMAVSDS